MCCRVPRALPFTHLLSALVLLFVASGCTGSPPSPVSTTTTTVPTPSRSVSARIDGAMWSSFSVTAGVQRGTLTMAAFGSATIAGSFTLSAPATVGTFNIGPSSIVEASLISASGSWEAYSQPAIKGSGSVTITSVTSTSAAGTFTFVMLPTSTSSTGTKSVTGGVFNVTF
jgi:hypothetical protein